MSRMINTMFEHAKKISQTCRAVNTATTSWISFKSLFISVIIIIIVLLHLIRMWLLLSNPGKTNISLYLHNTWAVIWCWWWYSHHFTSWPFVLQLCFFFFFWWLTFTLFICFWWDLNTNQLSTEKIVLTKWMTQGHAGDVHLSLGVYTRRFCEVISSGWT